MAENENHQHSLGEHGFEVSKAKGPLRHALVIHKCPILLIISRLSLCFLTRSLYTPFCHLILTRHSGKVDFPMLQSLFEMKDCITVPSF